MKDGKGIAILAAGGLLLWEWKKAKASPAPTGAMPGQATAPQVPTASASQLAGSVDLAQQQQALAQIYQDAAAAWGNEVVSGAIAHVRVNTFDGKPIMNASVTVGSHSALTNSSGYCDIHLEPGTYTVSVSAAGYAGQSVVRVLMPNENDITFALKFSQDSIYSQIMADWTAARNAQQIAKSGYSEPFFGSYEDILQAAMVWDQAGRPSNWW